MTDFLWGRQEGAVRNDLIEDPMGGRGGVQTGADPGLFKRGGGGGGGHPIGIVQKFFGPLWGHQFYIKKI